jgi:hypothetical protein
MISFNGYYGCSLCTIRGVYSTEFKKMESDYANAFGDDEWHGVEDGQDAGAGANFEFSGVHGLNPSFVLPENLENIEFHLRLFITDELLDNIAEWTNIRASESEPSGNGRC